MKVLPDLRNSVSLTKLIHKFLIKRHLRSGAVFFVLTYLQEHNSFLAIVMASQVR